MSRLIIVVSVLLCSAVFARDWPQWRGPFLNGSTDEKNLPGDLSRKENIAWVIPLPGPASATPVISGGKVFISSTAAGTSDLLGICLDAKNGKELWRKKMAKAERKFRKNNLASPSPVTDGKNVYFLYGSGELVGVDFDGNILWSRNLEREYGTLDLLFGYSASPLFYDGKLYIAVQRRNNIENGKRLDSFLLAIDPKNGKNIWKQERKTDAVGEALEAYSTPVFFENNGHPEIGVAGSDYITGHDPQSGRELWRFGFNPSKQTKWNTVPTAVTGDGIIYAAVGRGKQIIALRTGKTGLLTDEHVAWTFKGPVPDASTPLYYKGNIYVLDGKRTRILTCLDAKSGQQKWQGKLRGNGPWRASLTASDDKLYCISQAGDVVVLAANDKQFKIISQIELNEKPSNASIAIADGRLFIRTAKNLFCMGKR